MRIVAPNYFQTPNDLIDHWLPHLGESELKILLLIIRKTFGWNKERDRISLSQMEKFTGLSRSNVCSGINSLVEKGMILKEIEGVLGTEKVYYSLIIEDSSTSSDTGPPQFCNNTPPSTDAVPTKDTLTKDKKKQQQQSKPVVVVSSIEDENRQTLLEAGLDLAEIASILKNCPSKQCLQNAIDCSKTAKYDSLGAYLNSAVKNKWQPSKATESSEIKITKEKDELAKKRAERSLRAFEVMKKFPGEFEIHQDRIDVKIKSGFNPIGFCDDEIEKYFDYLEKK